MVRQDFHPSSPTSGFTSPSSKVGYGVLRGILFPAEFEPLSEMTLPVLAGKDVSLRLAGYSVSDWV